MTFDRRRFLAAAAAALVAPYVRTSHAAGSLAVGFWDHWVPGANDTLTKLCNEWAAKEKVDLKIDYITSQGNKILLTIASEAQAKSGHDILSLPIWYAADRPQNLEPVDDLVQPLIAQYGTPGCGRRIPRQAGRPLDRGAGHRRQPDEGTLRAHRSVQAARRPRSHQDVSGLARRLTRR